MEHRTTREWINLMKDEEMRNKCLCYLEKFPTATFKYHPDVLRDKINGFQYSFDWSSTPEGHYYWSGIHKLIDEHIWDSPEKKHETTLKGFDEVLDGVEHFSDGWKHTTRRSRRDKNEEQKTQITNMELKIRGWLNRIADSEIRLNALNEHDRIGLSKDLFISDVALAVHKAFIWKDTKQGQDYWKKVYDDAADGNLALRELYTPLVWFNMVKHEPTRSKLIDSFTNRPLNADVEFMCLADAIISGIDWGKCSEDGIVEEGFLVQAHREAVDFGIGVAVNTISEVYETADMEDVPEVEVTEEEQGHTIATWAMMVEDGVLGANMMSALHGEMMKNPMIAHTMHQSLAYAIDAFNHKETPQGESYWEGIWMQAMEGSIPIKNLFVADGGESKNINMADTRTIEQWFEAVIDPDIRGALLHAMRAESSQEPATSLAEAINYGFDWDDQKATKLSRETWEMVYKNAVSGSYQIKDVLPEGTHERTFEQQPIEMRPRRIREWYCLVASRELRKKLLNNVSQDNENTIVSSLAEAINLGFTTKDSPEGEAYWKSILIAAQKDKIAMLADPMDEDLEEYQLYKDGSDNITKVSAFKY